MTPSPVLHRILGIGNPLGIGVTGVRQGSVSAYAKPASGYIAANEMVCGEIARFLGLRVPSFGLAHPGVTGQPIFFCSLDFNFSGQQLPPANAAALMAALPAYSAGVIAFDCLVANTDRHPGNIAFDARPGQEPTLVIYDHSHALLGSAPGEGSQRLRTLRDRLALNLDGQTGGNRHCLADHLHDAALLGDWCERAATIPPWWLSNLVRSVPGLTAIETNETIEFLSHRSRNLRAILRANLNQFKSIQQTTLL
jgi:hypothetical protein